MWPRPALAAMAARGRSTTGCAARRPKGTPQQFVTETVPSRTAGKTSRRRREPEPWATIAVPALVDEATWPVQEPLQRNRAFAPQRQTGVYPAVGGAAHAAGRDWRAPQQGLLVLPLHAPGHAVRGGPLDSAVRCDAPWTKAYWLEEAVWERVAGLVRDPERLRAELAQRQDPGSSSRRGRWSA